MQQQSDSLLAVPTCLPFKPGRRMTFARCHPGLAPAHDAIGKHRMVALPALFAAKLWV